MVAKPSQLFRVAVVLVVGLALAACGPRGNSGAIHDASEDARAVKQLQGKWVLINFEPEVGFEPMLEGLLEAQRDTLLITFDDRTITAEGPGINLTRSYEVVKSVFDHVDLVVFGEDGTNYEMIGRFAGDDLEFESRTAPWKGRGRLRRP